jgi:hypothetical protein
MKRMQGRPEEREMGIDERKIFDDCPEDEDSEFQFK